MIAAPIPVPPRFPPAFDLMEAARDDVCRSAFEQSAHGFGGSDNESNDRGKHIDGFENLDRVHLTPPCLFADGADEYRPRMDPVNYY